MGQAGENVMQRSILLLRIAGVLVSLVSAVFTATEFIYRRPGAPAATLLEIFAVRSGVPAALVLPVELAAMLMFALLFWLTTRRSKLFRAKRQAMMLLACQAAIAGFSSTELLLLVAIEVAFFLELRPALIWVTLQSCFQIATFYWQIRLTGTHPLLGLFDVRADRIGLAMMLMTVSSQVWHLLSVGLGFLAANQTRQAMELLRVNAELRATRQIEAETARFAERLNLSRELHDSSGHHLAALSVNLRLMRRTDDPLEMASKLEESILIVQQLLAEVRGVVRDLRDVRAIELCSVLQTMVNGISGLEVHLCVEDGIAATDPLQAHALFRCSQEILTNAIKHSGAQNVWLTIGRIEEGFRLTARDDGRGSSKLVFGNGLRGIEERVLEMGGSLEVHCRQGQGFQIALLMPVRRIAV